jgi:hypothetical protein
MRSTKVLHSLRRLPSSTAAAATPTAPSSPETSAQPPPWATEAICGRIASVVRLHRRRIRGTVWPISGVRAAIRVAPASPAARHRSHPGRSGSIESWHLTHLLVSLIHRSLTYTPHQRVNRWPHPRRAPRPSPCLRHAAGRSQRAKRAPRVGRVTGALKRTGVPCNPAYP